MAEILPLTHAYACLIIGRRLMRVKRIGCGDQKINGYGSSRAPAAAKPGAWAAAITSPVARPVDGQAGGGGDGRGGLGGVRGAGPRSEPVGHDPGARARRRDLAAHGNLERRLAARTGAARLDGLG